MKNIDYGVLWTRWLFGFEVMLGQNKRDPLGCYGVIGLCLGPFYLFVRWRR